MWEANLDDRYEQVVDLNQRIINRDFDEEKMTLDEAIGFVDRVNQWILTWLTMEKIKTDAMVSICEQDPLYTPHLHAYLKKQEQVSEKIKTLRELWRAVEGAVEKKEPPKPVEIKEEEPKWVLESRKLEEEIKQIHRKISEAAVKGDEEKIDVLKKKKIALIKKQVKLYREREVR